MLRRFLTGCALICLAGQVRAVPAWNQFGELVDEKGQVVTDGGAQNNARAENTESPVNDFRLIPGERAGWLHLGQRSREILELMGKPTELSQRSEGIEEIVWNRGDEQTKVILAADAVVQIEVSNPKYRDVLGNGINSPLQTIFARYRAKGYELPKHTIYGVETPDGGGYEANIYDDVPAGIAYHLGTQENVDLSLPPDILIVHRAGKAAMPPKGATPLSLQQKAAQEKAQNAPTARPKLWKNSVPLGNGWPLTEIVTEEGARGYATAGVFLPGRVNFNAGAMTQAPPGQGLWHPLVYFYVRSFNDRPVWQDVSQVTFSWGYRRLALAAQKETSDAGTENGLPLVRTSLTLRFPYRDFLDMGTAGKFTMTVGGASFAVERPQTVGLRALARVCGAQNISLDAGQNSSTPSQNAPKLARILNRRPVRPYNEFFPQTLRRRLSASEVSALSDGDLRLAINEMFARHGLGFKDKSLQARFETLGWYSAREDRTYAVIVARMNPTERANLDLLAAERKRR